MFLLFISAVYDQCARDESGAVVNCTEVEWDPNTAQIPCSKLPPEFSICITHSFDKFAGYFPRGTLPEDGCPEGRSREGAFGVAVCQPTKGVYCIGEQYWVNRTYPCYEGGEYSPVRAIISSGLLGVLGLDRFYLGYYFLGCLKLLTLGGFFVWWIVDFVLLLLGVWGPRYPGTYSLNR